MNWIGAILVVTASYFCGVILAAQEGEKLAALESLMRLTEYMQRRMASERLELHALFCQFGNPFLEEKGFLPLLRGGQGEYGLLWEQGITLLPLEDRTSRELVRFGESLGRLCLEDQLKMLDECKSLIAEEKRDLAVTIRQKQKSIKAVCLLMGLAAAIILL